MVRKLMVAGAIVVGTLASTATAAFANACHVKPSTPIPCNSKPTPAGYYYGY